MSDLSDCASDDLSSIAAENSLLRNIYIDHRAYEVVSEYLRPECFSNSDRGIIFAKMVALMEKGEVVNSLALSSCILGNDDIGYTSALDYLDGVRADEVSIQYASKCGHVVYDLYLKRKLFNLAQRAIQRVGKQEHGVTTYDLIEDIDHQLYELFTQCDHEGGFQDFRTSIFEGVHEAEFERGGAQSGVNAGIASLDNVMGGFRPCELTILAGRHGMGTTSLARTIAYNVANAYHQKSGEEGAVVGFFSLGMPANHIVKPIVCNLASVSLEQVQNGHLTQEDFTRFVVTSQDLHRHPIFIDDTPNLSFSSLRSRAIRLKHQHDIGLIIVDCIQLLAGNRFQPDQSRKQILQTNISRLKMLAIDLDIPVLVIYRLPETAGEPRNMHPCIDDLHDLEGALSHVDTALLLYREQHDLEHAEPIREPSMSAGKFRSQHKRWKECIEETEGAAEVRVMDLTRGSSGNVKLQFDKNIAAFRDRCIGLAHKGKHHA